jgi:hypothetical protein
MVSVFMVVTELFAHESHIYFGTYLHDVYLYVRFNFNLILVVEMRNSPKIALVGEVLYRGHM